MGFKSILHCGRSTINMASGARTRFTPPITVRNKLFCRCEKFSWEGTVENTCESRCQKWGAKWLTASVLQSASHQQPAISLHFSWEPLLSVDSSVRDFGKIGLKCRAWIHAPQTEVVPLLCRPSFISVPDGERKRAASCTLSKRIKKSIHRSSVLRVTWGLKVLYDWTGERRAFVPPFARLQVLEWR